MRTVLVMSDSLENTRRKLIFRADHRGTKEMDLLMGGFAKKHVPDFNEDELAQFEELLQENDPNLYNWITGKEEPPEHVQCAVYERLKSFKLS